MTSSNFLSLGSGLALGSTIGIAMGGNLIIESIIMIVGISCIGIGINKK